jgi:hypothetical protein
LSAAGVCAGGKQDLREEIAAGGHKNMTRPSGGLLTVLCGVECVGSDL